MKKYGFTILNSLLAGILICGVLAARGVAERDFSAPEQKAQAVNLSVPTHISAPEPPAQPETEQENLGAVEQMPEKKEQTPADEIIKIAEENLGVRYASNGCTPEDGFDSSGFVYYCFKASGYDIPRRVKDQIKAGGAVGYSDLVPGDIAFFSAEEGGKANFCGIYAGGGLIIYSPAPGSAVRTANITTSYWTARFVSGARIL